MKRPRPIHIRRPVLTVGILVAAAWPSRAAMADAIYAWGDNSSGQFGNGTTTDSLSPLAIASMSSGVTAIAGSQATSLAIKSGAVYAWGNNSSGAVGNGSTSPSVVVSPFAIPSLSSGVTALSGAYYASSAIKAGAVYSWGDNQNGALGTGNTQSSYNPIQTLQVTTGVTAVASGGNGTADHSFAVKGGAVYAWGYANSFGDSGTGSSATITTPVVLNSLSTAVTAIAANQNNGAAVKSGALYAWGFNHFGQLGDGTATERDTPVAISSMSSGVTAVALGNNFMMILKGGAVYTTGDNTLGELGTGLMSGTDVPVLILPAADSIVQIAAGLNSAYALSSDGTLYDWGDNRAGELGTGNKVTQSTPFHLLPTAGNRFTAIDAENDTALALVSPAPEPATLVLAAMGGAALLLRRRENRKFQGA